MHTHKDYKILAHIPARKGSKGIPCKNITPLGGMPLLAWSIRTALASQYIGRVIVNTDSPDIAAVALEYGAEVPFLRPQEISGSSAFVNEAFSYCLSELHRDEGYTPDISVHLFPTSPFRTTALVDNLIKKLLTENYKNAATASPIPTRHSDLYHLDDGTYCPVILDSLKGVIPQGISLKGVALAQAVYTRLPANYPPDWYEVITDPIMTLDIDHPEDLALARALVAKELVPV